MAGIMRKAMLYLGLAPDEEYDDDDHAEEAPRQPARPASAARPLPAEPLESTGAVRTIVREPEQPAVSLRPSRGSVVRPVPGPIVSAKPYTVTPRSFNEAQEVADKFKDGQPVIMNLQTIDRELSRRLIDFASGLCYGLAGHMEKVAHQVYLLTPSNVEVSAEERRRLAERSSRP